MKTKQKASITLSLILILILLTGISCERLFPVDQLCTPRIDFIGDELRIDGYFYHVFGPSGNEHMGVLFFFRNGVLHDITIPKVELEEREEEWRNNNWNERTTNSRFSWGVFTVDNDVIKLERWYPGPPHITAIREGVILNDTTFKIIKSYRCDGSGLRERHELYRFRAFYPKPDSTNNFVR